MGGTTAVGYKREAGMPSSSMPAPLREIGFDQNIGQRLPLETPVVDESGRTVRIGSYFSTRPVILLFAYYSCPMLCTQVINGLASAVGVLSLKPGRDFEVVVVSFDPRDTPQTSKTKKDQYLQRYTAAGAEAATHFVTASEPAIERLTKSAGFRYVWDKETQQFAHPTGVIVLTPDGRMARYLFGIEYGPRDLRLALVEASSGQVGSAVDTLLLYCYHYDPMTGRYGVAILRTLRIAGASTVLALGTFVFVMFRREKHRQVR
jgi:protein SCO1/2